jgi:hypothetical protein
MHTEHKDKYTDGNYEREDISFKMLINIGMWLVIITVGTYIVSVPLISVSRKLMGRGEQFSFRDFYWGEQHSIPTRKEERRNPFPKNTPLLQDQTTAHTDIANMRNRENEILANGGVDESNGKVMIPIEQAIQLEAAEKGR